MNYTFFSSIMGVPFFLFLTVCTNQTSAQISFVTVVNELVTKAESRPDATIDYSEYKFTLNIDKFHSLVSLLVEQTQSSQFEFEPVLTFISDTNTAPKRESWVINLRVNGNVTYETKERNTSFDTINLLIAESAESAGAQAMPRPDKRSTWWDSVRSTEILDDRIVIDRVAPVTTYPRADLDMSYFPWMQALDPERTVDGQTVSVQEYENGEVVITLTNQAGTPSATCVSQAFDKSHNWRPVRAWFHAPEDNQSFIGWEQVWLYSTDSDHPVIAYECNTTQSMEMSVTLRHFTNWAHSCESLEFRLPPRYVYVQLQHDINEPTAVFHEAQYLEAVLPEDLLYVAVVKIMNDWGQDIPESDFVVDGLIDCKDLERAIVDLTEPTATE